MTKKSIYHIFAGIKYILTVVLITLLFYTTIPIKTTATLLVPQGSISNLINHLQTKGHAVSVLDRYILRAIGKPQAGWIYIGKKELNRVDFFYKLTAYKARLHDITLIPGQTLYVFFESIAKEMDLNATKLQKHYNTLSPYPEAGIFSDTYLVPFGMREESLVEFLVQESEKKFISISEKIFGVYETKEWHKILTIASIIQKEAANKEEMPLVASVIYNRLAINMPLQMDGTLNYGKYSGTKVTPERIRNDTSHFNTYKHKGLPPSPIGAISLDSILAAVKPAQTDYLYFVRNAEGTHDFSKTFKEHRKAIER
ncbi:MAG TPA: endolytic transglycosylase MltG [Epsilonproteobacteria bacterium]|nr:endolytic transglycosylase MltG [Campylobacterota bacterium]